MPTLHKFADHVRGVKSAELVTVISSSGSDEARQWDELSIDEKRALLRHLEQDISAAAQKQDGPKTRLAAVKAAAVSADPRTRDAFNSAVLSLRALGADIEAIAASGSLGDIDQRMKDLKWTTTRRMALKHSLSVVGAIS
jgi:hypothetical protein